jgi:hypothetical protein
VASAQQPNSRDPFNGRVWQPDSSGSRNRAQDLNTLDGAHPNPMLFGRFTNTDPAGERRAYRIGSPGINPWTT